MPSLPLRTGQQLPLPKLRSGLGLPQSGLNFSATVLSKIKISLIPILLCMSAGWYVFSSTCWRAGMSSKGLRLQRWACVNNVKFRVKCKTLHLGQ